MFEEAQKKLTSQKYLDDSDSVFDIYTIPDEGETLIANIHYYDLESSLLDFKYFEQGEFTIELLDENLHKRIFNAYKYDPIMIIRRFNDDRNNDIAFFLDDVFTEKTYDEDNDVYVYKYVLQLVSAFEIMARRLARPNVFYDISPPAEGEELPENWMKYLATKTFDQIMKDLIDTGIQKPYLVSPKSKYYEVVPKSVKPGGPLIKTLSGDFYPTHTTSANSNVTDKYILDLVSDWKHDVRIRLIPYKTTENLQWTFEITNGLDIINLSEYARNSNFHEISQGYNMDDYNKSYFIYSSDNSYYQQHKAVYQVNKVMPYEKSGTMESSSNSELAAEATDRLSDGTPAFIDATFASSDITPFEDFQLGDLIRVASDDLIFGEDLTFQVTGMTETIEESTITYEITYEVTTEE